MSGKFLRDIVLIIGLFLVILRNSCAVTDDDVALVNRNGVYFAQLNMTVAVPAALALKVLTDFDHMAAFMHDLNESRILEQQGNTYRVLQRGKARFGPFAFPYESERKIDVLEGGRIRSRSLSGSARRMEREMRVKSAEQGCQLEYRIEIEPDNWLPSSLAGNFLQHALAEQFNALQREMMRRQGTT